VEGAFITLLPLDGEIKEKLGPLTKQTDSNGFATFNVMDGKAEIIIRKPGYKTFKGVVDLNSYNLFIGSPHPGSPDAYFCLEKGESSGCSVIVDKQIIKVGDSVNVNVNCLKGEDMSCKQSYVIDCGNGETTTTKNCGEGLCEYGGKCTYNIPPDQSSIGKIFMISTLDSKECENASVIIGSTGTRLIESVNPSSGFIMLYKKDITFYVKTYEEARCEFLSTGIPSGAIILSGTITSEKCSIAGAHVIPLNSKDGLIHTYTVQGDCFDHWGTYDFLVRCYRKSDNFPDASRISLDFEPTLDMIKSLPTIINTSICVNDLSGNPVKNSIVTLTVSGTNNYHNPKPVITGDDGCADISFYAPIYLDEGFDIISCFGQPKGENGYLTEQCGKIKWKYPPQPIIVTTSGTNVVGVKFQECEEKKLKISFNPPGPFIVESCKNFNVGVYVTAVCKVGGKEYSNNFIFADVNGKIVGENEPCSSDGYESHLFINSYLNYNPSSSSMINFYLGVFKAPCENGDYKICINSTDMLGIFNSSVAYTTLHIGENEDCKITLKLKCNRISPYEIQADANVIVEKCAFPYKLQVREIGGGILDDCEFIHGKRIIYDIYTLTETYFPQAYSEDFSCSGRIGQLSNDKTGFSLMETSAEDWHEWKTLANLYLNCTAGESGETSWSP
jgi:hypothetical protein